MNFDEIFICSTDTVVGIGGPISSQTLETIYFLKKRPKNKKIMILVGSIEQALRFTEWQNYKQKEALKWVHKYWPGAYSIILNNQGFRMPNNAKLLSFLLKNGPIYMTSANLSGQAPISLEEANIIFPQVKQIYDFGSGTNEASKIYNLDKKKWIR